ncbi:hypothetical protein H257_06849 [Aphanomyces astaci]|uniref:Uncharacterized protein n=1 Tax=Aphanomyces astaci TaxID=112090 RepID=W4GIS6_APHAT|nr:hypothetical protein H257_06849 [Aphanomyces astaci]ETV79590.1 hypothetical protein H257_06849 [Aphanomyces astaci]|eukprot:XP_009830526.1 hypothetical protein H257_06849 [Aphanomyces astaci]
MAWCFFLRRRVRRGGRRYCRRISESEAPGYPRRFEKPDGTKIPPEFKRELFLQKELFEPIHSDLSRFVSKQNRHKRGFGIREELLVLPEHHVGVGGAAVGFAEVAELHEVSLGQVLAVLGQCHKLVDQLGSEGRLVASMCVSTAERRVMLDRVVTAEVREGNDLLAIFHSSQLHRIGARQGRAEGPVHLGKFQHRFELGLRDACAGKDAVVGHGVEKRTWRHTVALRSGGPCLKACRWGVVGVRSVVGVGRRTHACVRCGG